MPMSVVWSYVSCAALVAIGLAALFVRRDWQAARGLDKLILFGPLFYAAPLAAFGTEHFTVTAGIASLMPAWIPWHRFWVYLVGACFIAVGLFISTLTRNQIVAGTLTFGLLLGLWILGWMDDPSAGAVAQAVAKLGLLTHLESLMKGVIDLKDVVFYLSFIVFGLFMAHQSVESQRWRA